MNPLERRRRVAPETARHLVGVAACGLFVVGFFVPLWARPLHYLLPHLGFLIAWLAWGAPRFPREVTAILCVAAVLNGIGWAWRWLDVVPGYDDLVHAFVTFALVVPATLGLSRGDDPPRTWRARIRFAFVPLGIGVTGGVVWELYEWTCDHISSAAAAPGSMSLDDTILDLLSGLFGSLVAIPVALHLLGSAERDRRLS